MLLGFWRIHSNSLCQDQYVASCYLLCREYIPIDNLDLRSLFPVDFPSEVVKFKGCMNLSGLKGNSMQTIYESGSLVGNKM